MILDPRLPPKIAEQLYPVPHCGCWVWVGSRLSRNGYGRVWHEGKERQVHILVYTLLVGPVARGLHLDHGCRVRPCANPAHLEPVTPRVNTLRGEAVLFKPIGATP